MATCGEHERQLCPLKLIPVHVSGHQDKEKSWDSLSWLEQLNCEADRHAKLALNAQVPPLTDRSLTGNHCALMIQGKIIIMNQRERERVPLYHYIHKQEALDYWKKTDKVGADVSVINWASIGRLNRNTPPPFTIALVFYQNLQRNVWEGIRLHCMSPMWELWRCPACLGLHGSLCLHYLGRGHWKSDEMAAVCRYRPRYSGSNSNRSLPLVFPWQQCHCDPLQDWESLPLTGGNRMIKLCRRVSPLRLARATEWILYED